MADIQTELRHQYSNSRRPPCLWGSSTHNQRIEAFWRHARQRAIQRYMDLFANLAREGDFTGDLLDKNLIRFCFMRNVQVSF